MINLNQESHSLTAVQESVIVSQGKIHHLLAILATITAFSPFLRLHAEVWEHTGRISTLPFTATGLSLIAWSPRTA